MDSSVVVALVFVMAQSRFGESIFGRNGVDLPARGCSLCRARELGQRLSQVSLLKQQCGERQGEERAVKSKAQTRTFNTLTPRFLFKRRPGRQASRLSELLESFPGNGCKKHRKQRDGGLSHFGGRTGNAGSLF